ncbi:MAG: hypothetical protein GY953_58085, partial [bacterium]|nr:hypothetical protein [bacterium]
GDGAGGDGGDGAETYRQVRELTRARRGLARGAAAASNRIHAIVDELFPEFTLPVYTAWHLTREIRWI